MMIKKQGDQFSAEALFCNGEWLSGKGEALSSLNPMNGQTIWSGHAASPEQVASAVASARDAQLNWGYLPLEDRIEIIEKFAQQLAEHQAEIAQCISLETGKPSWEAKTEVQAMINKVAISIRAQSERAGEWRKENLGLGHHAHGVMVVFGPYNFPGHLPNGHIVPALLAGNTIVFKPSEETPLTAILTLHCWQKAGLPKGVINLIQGSRSVGEALCQQPIDGLLFTGSSTVGKLLHQQFGGRPEVMLALEMGGNNALIADEDIHVEAAAQIIVRSAFLSAGQRCTCTRRLIVVESKQSEALIAAVVELASNLITDAPDAEPAPFMGPVIHIRAAQQIVTAQQNLQAAGGHNLLEAKPLDDYGCLLSPGIIDVTQARDIPDEEWFGPLLQIYRVENFEQAVELANQTQFGLAAGLISDDLEHQRVFKQRIRAGVVSINQPTAGASSELPFGGIGASGNHRPSAYYAADYCAWPQSVMTGAHTEQQTTFPETGIRS